MDTIKSGQIIMFANSERLDQLLNIIIGTGYVAHFTLLHQIVKGPECFLNWGIIIWLMGIINVEVIGIQPLKLDCPQ